MDRLRAGSKALHGDRRPARQGGGVGCHPRRQRRGVRRQGIPHDLPRLEKILPILPGERGVPSRTDGRRGGGAEGRIFRDEDDPASPALQPGQPAAGDGAAEPGHQVHPSRHHTEAVRPEVRRGKRPDPDAVRHRGRRGAGPACPDRHRQQDDRSSGARHGRDRQWASLPAGSGIGVAGHAL